MAYDPKAVAVLSTSFYKDPLSADLTRYALARTLIAKATNAGHRVITVDGSPSTAHLVAFAEAGALVLEETEHGIGPSRRQLFTAGGELSQIIQAFLWTEIEKEGLVQFIPMIAEPLLADEADIVMLQRKNLGSYPEFQAETETIADRVFQEVTGIWDASPMFGPVAFNRRALPLFAKCNPKVLFGGYDTYIQHIPPIYAKAQGLRVAVVTVDFTYPPEQRAEEEGALTDAMRKKRLSQLRECTTNYLLAARAVGFITN